MDASVGCSGKHHIEAAHSKRATIPTAVCCSVTRTLLLLSPRKAWLFLRSRKKRREEQKQARRKIYVWMYVYGCFQNNLTRPMMGFEAGALRLAYGMLKCSKKGITGDEIFIFKTILGYSSFFSVISGCN